MPELRSAWSSDMVGLLSLRCIWVASGFWTTTSLSKQRKNRRCASKCSATAWIPTTPTGGLDKLVPKVRRRPVGQNSIGADTACSPYQLASAPVTLGAKLNVSNGKTVDPALQREQSFAQVCRRGRRFQTDHPNAEIGNYCEAAISC